MSRKGEKSLAKFSGGAGKGRAHNDSRSQAPVVFHANRVVLRSDRLKTSGVAIADSLDSKKKKKKKEERRNET